MREQSPQSMLQWISRTYGMSPAALARMFQRNQRTITHWLNDGRISVKNGTRIRTSFSLLTNRHDPQSERSPLDM
jgi:AraC-like DNA-binding protein